MTCEICGRAEGEKHKSWCASPQVIDRIPVVVGDGMNEASETVPCKLCSRPTRMTGTKLCDSCWEVDRRLAGFLSAPAARALVRLELAKVERVVAIESGGDWADASVDHVVVPAGVDLRAAEQAHEAWIVDEYCCSPIGRGNVEEHKRTCPRPHEYMTFDAWLVARHGARYADEDAGELETYRES